MANKTPLIGLAKPELSEYASVGMLNGDMDLIDAALGQRSRVNNLLDNSCFLPAYVVKQRGSAAEIGAKYSIDRWKGTTSATQHELTEEGFKITHTSTSNYCGVQQVFPADLVAYIKDKTVTVAVCLADGSVYVRSGVPANGSVSANFGNGFAQTYLNANTGAMSVRIMHSNAGGSVTVRWVALYEGAYTAETLPAYQQKGYAAELLACQQYLRRFTDKVEACGAVDASTITFGIDSLGMAGIPSIKVNSIAHAKLPCAYLSSSQLSGASVVGMGNATIKSSVTLTPREAGYILMSYDLSCEP